jgi:putative membrane protein
MKNFFMRWGISAMSIFVVAHIVKGIEVPSIFVVLVVALVLGIVNAFLRPVIVFLTLPLNVLTLGVFTFFINGALFYFVAYIVKGFTITSFWSAFVGYILVSIISFAVNFLAFSVSAIKKIRDR